MKSFQIHVIEKICKKNPKKSLINNYFGINSWLTIIYAYRVSWPLSLAGNICTTIKCMLTPINVSSLDYDVLLMAQHNFNIQIMTKVYILSCFMPFLAYRNKKRANGPISLFLYFRNGIKQDRIYTEVIICFISQSGYLKQLIIR